MQYLLVWAQHELHPWGQTHGAINGLCTRQDESGVEPHPEVEEDGRHVDDAAENGRRLKVALVLHDLPKTQDTYMTKTHIYMISGPAVPPSRTTFEFTTTTPALWWVGSILKWGKIILILKML
jgi:hypothetical protein